MTKSVESSGKTNSDLEGVKLDYTISNDIDGRIKISLLDEEKCVCLSFDKEEIDTLIEYLETSREYSRKQEQCTVIGVDNGAEARQASKKATDLDDDEAKEEDLEIITSQDTVRFYIDIIGSNERYDGDTTIALKSSISSADALLHGNGAMGIEGLARSFATMFPEIISREFRKMIKRNSQRDSN